MLSVLDIFRIGIGPSSSHTVGPMRISQRFWKRLGLRKHLADTDRIRVIFRGSLAFTGVGHGTPRAAKLGLLGFKPETIDLDAAEMALRELESNTSFSRDGKHVHFDPAADIVMDYEQAAELHPNEMEMQAFDAQSELIYKRTYYSTGGGFTASHAQLSRPAKNDRVKAGGAVPYNFTSADMLLSFCAEHNLTPAELIFANEESRRPRDKTNAKLDRIVDVMLASIQRGLHTRGQLPGGLKVDRRAPDIWAKLSGAPNANERETSIRLAQCLRHGCERRKCGGRSGRYSADKWSGRHYPRHSAALLLR